MESAVVAELMSLLDEKRYSEFMKKTDGLRPVDVADFLSTLNAARLPSVFRLLKKDTGADIFAELDADARESLICAMSDSEIAFIIEELYTDDAVDMLEELPAGMVTRVLRLAKPQTRAAINKFLNYAQDSAGGIMTSEFISLKADMKVFEATEYIRKNGIDKETVYNAYVTDRERKLLGTVELRSLIFAEPDESISKIMNSPALSVSTGTDREDTAALISKYDLLSLPVVDNENRLVGIVTVDDAIDVLENEASKDISIMAAVTPTERPYLKTGVFTIFRSRIPWLLLLMLSATFTGIIITAFESALSSLVILTAFIPMLMGTGGNAGAQVSVTVTRAISLGELSPSDLFTILKKELSVSLLCGGALAAASFIKICAFDMLLLATPGVSVTVALTVSLTLLCTVVSAKLTGALLPLAATRIGLDPALVASPAITTTVDIISLLVYFGIARSILGI